MVFRPARPLAPLLACVGSIALGCGGGPADGERINVLLISIDTARADSLGAYGHPEIETPNIDRLAAEGVLFEQCASPAPLTVPTHASMMTGTYPFVHGVRDNGNFTLGEESRTLAEALGEEGYATAGQVAVFVLDRHSGLAQGFDAYLDTYGAAIADAEDVPLSRRSANELRADAVADRAIEWLAESAGEPFFLFVHFFDPHAPYEPPEPFLSRYQGPDRSAREGRYLGEIAYVDQQLGRLLEQLTALGLDERTLVVLTADHGEALGEHSEIGHSYFIYDTTVRVPLILRLPGRLPAGARVERQVRTVDIAPTILELTGSAPLTDAQGVSLAPYLEDAASDLDLRAYSETMAPLLDYGYSPLRGLRDGRWKYILAPRPELYDLVADPGEEDNVHDARPRIASEMRRRLRRLVTAAAAPAAATNDPGAEQRARLESLGYVSGAVSSTAARRLAAFEPAGPDPKDRIEQMTRAAAALRAFHDRNYPHAEELYRELVAGDPESALFTARLADTLLARGRVEAARAAYRRVLELDPDHAGAHRQVGRLYLGQGDPASALRHLAELTRVSPEDPSAFVEYGRLLAMGRRLGPASEALRRALDLDPSRVDALDLLAKVSVVQGDYPRAAELMETALEERPDALEVVLQLAWLRATCPDADLRDGRLALELAERAERLEAPPGTRSSIARAAALAASGRWEEATAVAERVSELPADSVAAAYFAERASALAALYRQRRLHLAGEPL